MRRWACLERNAGQIEGSGCEAAPKSAPHIANLLHKTVLQDKASRSHQNRRISVGGSPTLCVRISRLSFSMYRCNEEDTAPCVPPGNTRRVFQCAELYHVSQRAKRRD
eukprot:2064089-Rhodomonas_salina.1